jgi:MFS transporter, FSR family, fosmidomycin resistance protein
MTHPINAFHPEAAVAAGRALPEHRTRAISVFMLGGALGLGLGPIISGAIARTWGVAGLVGLMPVLIILIGVFWWTGRLGSLSPKTKTDAPRLSISEAFEGRGKLALAIFLICSLRLVPNMAVAKVLSFMLVGWGYDEFQTGLVQSLFLAAASVGMFLMAFRFRAGSEKSFMIWCPIAGIPMLAIMGWPSCPSWLFMTMLIATGLTLWGTIPAMVSYAQQQFPKGAGMASAITMGLAWGLGGIIQAPITAHFSETSHPQQAFFAFIPCLIISAIGARMLPPSHEPKAD